MVNCAKQVLVSMQKKTDFRPEIPEVAVCTPVGYIQPQMLLHHVT